MSNKEKANSVYNNVKNNGTVSAPESKEGKFAALWRKTRTFFRGGKQEENAKSIRKKKETTCEEKSSRQLKNKRKKTIRKRNIVLDAKHQAAHAAHPPMPTPQPVPAPNPIPTQIAAPLPTVTLAPERPVQGPAPRAIPSHPKAGVNLFKVSKEIVPPDPSKEPIVPPQKPALPPVVLTNIDITKDRVHRHSATGDDGGDKTQSLSESVKGPRRSAKQVQRCKNSSEMVVPPGNQGPQTEATVKVAIEAHRANVILAIRRFLDKTIQTGVIGLVAEFKTFGKTQPTVAEHKTFLENLARNRYKDVPCVEATRVKVANNPDKLDYIHANYVGTDLNARKFICTQAPMQLTLYEFWLMILNDNCQAIVMLCNIMENNAPKCVQYWHPVIGETVTIRNIAIKTLQKTSLVNCSDVVVTVLAAKNMVTNVVNVIKHYQWITWPDKAVPKDEKPLMIILQEVRKYLTPIVVHCSAGIGRTGSVVMVEMAMEKFTRGQVVDMAEILRNLRKQRANCCQTETQYLFVHFTIMHHFVRMCTINENYPGLQKFYADYERICNAVK